MRIAIHQPYLFPYLNYFRLIATTDLFVIFDCVQHIRRGYVHRNRLPTHNITYDWITLPLKNCPRETLIKDLEFADNAAKIWQKTIRRFPLFDEDRNDWYLFGTPCSFIVKNLQAICSVLTIPFNVIYSSELNIPAEIKGKDRIMEICRILKATEYVNAPGGRAMYDPGEFAKSGIALNFLPDYPNKKSILERVCSENLKDLHDEICN